MMFLARSGAGLFVQAQALLQHLVGVFALVRRRAAHGQALAVQRIGRGQHGLAAGLAVLEAVQQAGVGRALRVQGLEQAQHLAAGNLRGRQAFEQLGAREAQQLGLHQRHQQIAVCRACGIGGKALVGGPLGLGDDVGAKALELAVVAHGDDQRAVGRLEHAVGHDGRMGVAELGGSPALSKASMP